MAAYHLSVKTVSRSAGRSSTAAAAYRAGEKLECERTGQVHDYRRKNGIESATLFLPANAPAMTRAELWNAAEKSETRKNSTVAREFEIALPAELNADQRKALAHAFTRALVDKFGFAADCAIHAPGKDGDDRNYHAHVLCTTRVLNAGGFGEKTRVLDDQKTGAANVVEIREFFADLTNHALQIAGTTERVSHLSLKAQGIEREPTVHLGPSATAIERRGETSQITENANERQREQQQRQAEQQRAADERERVAVAAAIAQARAEAAAAIAEAQASAAAEVAREQQIKQQHAAAQAQAAHDLATAEKATQEKENDRIRKSALAALAKSSGATEAAIDASRGYLRASARVANNYGPSVGNAIEGAERRVAGSHLNGCTPAVGRELRNVDRVLQQLVDRFPKIVRTVASAVNAAVQNALERAKKAIERAPVAAQTQAKVITPETQKTPAQHPEIAKISFWFSGDKALAQRANVAYSGTTPANAEERAEIARDIQTAISEAQQDAKSTAPKSISRDTIERAIKSEQNAAAVKKGQPEPWKDGQQSCTWYVLAANLDRERQQHLQTPRPAGMFAGAAKKEYDDKTEGFFKQLTQINSWTKHLETELTQKVTQRVDELAQQAAKNAPTHAMHNDRIAALQKLNEVTQRERRALEAKETQKQSNTLGAKLPTLPNPLAKLPRAPSRGGMSR